MNKKIIPICITIIVALIIAIIIVITSFAEKETQIDIEREIISESIIIKDKKTQYENSKKSVNVVIPEFQNLNSDYGNYINSKIYKELNDTSVYENAIQGYSEQEIQNFTYETNYQRYNVEDYISIVATQYIHIGDGRPRNQKKCYVIDARNNMSPALVDIFVEKNAYKAAIIEEINNQASAKNIELIGGNGLKEISDTQAFYIKEGKLIIYFEASEIAATAVGELEFEMPFKMSEGKIAVGVATGVGSQLQ